MSPSILSPRRATTDEQAKDALRRGVKILVIGAGGLGCEILQNLALSTSMQNEVADDQLVSVIFT
jgi:ubiquitin-activating enzyme E1 C